MVTWQDLCSPEVVQSIVKRMVATRVAEFNRFAEECKRFEDEDSCDEPIVVVSDVSTVPQRR